MPRAVWTGSLTFGLVNIPVKLYSATDQKDIRFHQFEKGTGKRIRYRRVAEGTDREVDYDDIVKGYELEEGRYVMVTPEELEAVEPRRTRAIEIEDFVDLDEIDPIHYERTYYVAPAEDTGADRPYALLLRAMERANRAGIGRFVLRRKEYLAAIRPLDGALALETMLFPDEVRSLEDVETLPAKGKVPQRELSVALQLIDSLSTEWKPERYRDTYRQRALELIEAKAEGKTVEVEEQPAEPKVLDLMAALRESVERIRGEGDGGVRTRKRVRTAREDGAGAEEVSKRELLERAQQLGISGRSKMSKRELAEAVRKAS